MTGRDKGGPSSSSLLSPEDLLRVFNATPPPYLILSPDFTIVAVNDAYLEATLTRREDIIGRPMFEVFPDNPEDPHAHGVAALTASLKRVMATHAPDTMPVQKYDIRRPAERGGGFEERYWSPVNSPVMDDQGQVAYIIHRAEDVTDFLHMKEQRDAGKQDRDVMSKRIQMLETEMFLRSRELHEANLRLREANEAMAAVDRAKTVFFSNVSHELRTPLTLILGPVTDLIQETEGLGGKARAELVLVHRNALRLLKLVNAVLEFSRVEAGRIATKYEATDLSSFTAELAGVFRSAIEQAGLRFIVDCPPLPEMAYVDRSMWEKIVLNLLSNAFKFTLQGEIEVALHAKGHQAELVVRDTGTGIPGNELPHIFDRFHRVDGKRGRSQEGAGIGLALVQELVRIHQGGLQVESREGEGSNFIVTLPLGRQHLPDAPSVIDQSPPAHTTGAFLYAEEAAGWLPHEPAIGPEPESGGLGEPGQRILVAEDNVDMRGYICRLLGQQYQVEAVADGRAALAAIRVRPPDLVLTDVWMLGMSGVELVRELRKNSRTSTLPVIILSASATEEARIEGLKAGADDYLIKPFSARELLARIANQLAQSAHARHLQALQSQAEAAKVHLEMILESVREAFLAVDRSWRITYANTHAAQEVGKLKQALIGQDAWEAFSVPPLSHIRPLFKEAMRNRTAAHTEYRHDPTGRWWEMRAFPSEEGLVIFSTDITEHRQREMTLQDSQRRLSLALEAGKATVWEIEGDTGTVHGAEHLGRVLGYGADEVNTVTDWLALVSEDQRADLAQILEETVEGKRDEYSCEWNIRARDGTWHWFLCHGKAIEREAKGRARRIIATYTEIDERKAAEAEIKRLNTDLEQRVLERTTELELSNEALLRTNMELEHFAHATAHDLQTPLRSIASFTQLLQQAVKAHGDAQVDEWASQVIQNTKRLQNLIQELLSYTRLEGQGLPFAEVDMDQVLAEVIGSLQSLVCQTGAEIHCEHLSKITADRGQLGQLLQNLIENSIKYNQSNPPKIWISCERQEDDWLFSVADNGIGIDPKHHERIFDIFKRLHTYTQIPGTGIGLALCRRIVERHGGRIWVESRPGEGSTFYFTLPVK